MKIVLATPLYPPDIEPTALYCKELAKQLSKKDNNLVTVVTYGHLPEQIPGVTMIATDKRNPLLFRIVLYFYRLWRASRNADILYVQNGISTELPVLIVTMVTKTPFVLFLTDPNAIKQTQKSNIHRIVNKKLTKHARAIITKTPPERPEILSFSPRPDRELLEYRNSWDAHLQTLSNIKI